VAADGRLLLNKGPFGLANEPGAGAGVKEWPRCFQRRAPPDCFF
jgi:hypothetical protein